MNILHWPSSYPDPARGEPFHCIFVEEHIRSIHSMSANRVLFISPHSTLSKKWHERVNSVENGVPVSRFYFNKKLNLQFLNFYIRLILIAYFIDLIVFKKFYPQIIHLHFFIKGKWALPFAKLFNIKTVVTEHWTALIGYPVISSNRLKDAKYIYENSDWLLPVSTHLKDGIIHNTHAEIANKYTVIHNCVNTEIFNHQTPSHNPNQLISVVRLDEQKDIPTMLKAFAIARQHTKSLTLSIVGGGDQTPFINIANELGLATSVQFKGILSKFEIAALMNQSNLFLLSSIAENSPCVIGEAHCCGLPVIATDVGGVKELIIEGETVPPRSPELLADKIIKQLQATVDREKLAQTAQQRFGYDAIGTQLINVYRKVCAE